MMVRIWKLFSFILIISFFCFPSTAFAVSIRIISAPETITVSDEFQVDAIIEGAKKGTNYLRIDMYKEGSTSYFGETWNGTAWYDGSEGIQYPSIPIDGASSSAHLKGRLGKFPLSSFDSSSRYYLRIRRYTQSGGSAHDSSDIREIHLSFPTPATPILLPTMDPTSSPIIVTSTPQVLQATVESTPAFSPSYIDRSVVTSTAFPSSIPTTEGSATSSPFTQETMFDSSLFFFIVGGGLFLVSVATFFRIFYTR